MRASFSLLLLLFALAGCRDSARIAHVSGRVMLNGKPLANAAVMFQPIGSDNNTNPGPGSAGTTDADGRYTLHMVGKNTRGAVVDKHQVRIAMMEKGDSSDDSPKPPNPLQARFYRNSPLECDVPEGGTDTADFNLLLEP
jgi:hypothetical protein